MDSKIIVPVEVYALASMNLIITIVSLRFWRKYRSKQYFRNFWIRDIFLRREEQGYYCNLVQEMRDHDSDSHFQFFRMSKEQFDLVLSFIQNKIFKKRTNFRKSISPEERLAVTLRFLASGDMQVSLCFGFRISKTALSNIIRETCEAIWESMAPIYLKMPNKPEDWKEIASGFYEQWNLPNCCGSIDGKHVSIVCPANSGSTFFNYKGHFSIVLLAVCDPQYRYVMVNIGSYGSESDGGIFSSSEFGTKLKYKRLPLPDPNLLPNSNIRYPYYFIGDEAFPLLEYLLRPYPGRGLSLVERIFNYRLSRARRVIENTFGIMAAQWRVYHKTIKGKPENIDRVIIATVCLHNFLITNEMGKPIHKRQYNGPEFADTISETGELLQNGRWREIAEVQGALRDFEETHKPNRTSKLSQNLRDKLAKYLCSEGAIPHQYDYVTRQ